VTCNDVVIRELTKRPVKCIRDDNHGGAHKWVDNKNRLVLLWFRDNEDEAVAS
jgi:hypothetical protein